MNELIANFLKEQGVPAAYLPIAEPLAGVFIILFFLAISYYITKHQVLVLVQRMVARSRNTLDDLLLEHKVFRRLSMLVPYLVLLFITPKVLIPDSQLSNVLVVLAKIAISFQVALAIAAVLNVIKSAYEAKAKEKYLPLNAAIQVIKLVIYMVASILAISYILDRSPLYLLSGLGALTAVLLLVFQDTIKGLVASIQISANRMVAPGDWVSLPNYGADGDVLEIGLNTVKIQNFDRTVTTVPTYALISGSFKNWRDMVVSGGRRVKRTIAIDVSSIRFYQPNDIEALSEINLLKGYLQDKHKEIADSAAQENVVLGSVNARQLTNIGTFRAYIEAYLKQHQKVHKEMTCMVRQLAATSTGLPLELYFFTNDNRWVPYEGIQADIFDHLYAMAPIFDIRVFQHPSGHDWRQNVKSS